MRGKCLILLGPMGHIRAFFVSSSDKDGEPQEVLSRGAYTVRKMMAHDKA